jgi:hypothetical protein
MMARQSPDKNEPRAKRGRGKKTLAERDEQQIAAQVAAIEQRALDIAQALRARCRVGSVIGFMEKHAEYLKNPPQKYMSISNRESQKNIEPNQLVDELNQLKTDWNSFIARFNRLVEDHNGHLSNRLCNLLPRIKAHDKDLTMTIDRIIVLKEAQRKWGLRRITDLQYFYLVIYSFINDLPPCIDSPIECTHDYCKALYCHIANIDLYEMETGTPFWGVDTRKWLKKFVTTPEYQMNTTEVFFFDLENAFL